MRTDPSDLTQVEQGYLAIVREIRDREQVVVGLMRPLIARARTEAGNNHSAVVALTQQIVEGRDDVKGAIVRFTKLKTIRTQLIRNGFIPSDATGSTWKQPNAWQLKDARGDRPW